MKYVVRNIIVLAVFSAVIFAGITFHFISTAPGEPSEKVVFEVEPSTSFKSVARRLKEKNLITSEVKLSLLARVMGYTTKIKTGEYELNGGMGPLEVLKILASGKSLARPLTIKEGENIYEVAQLIESLGLGTKSEFLRLCKDKTLINELLRENVNSLEGYLFPETYMVTKYTKMKTLVENMVRNFLRVYESLENKSGVGLTRHQTVILASIIEKETGAAEERPIISSVFHNRLKKKMKLQTDPTILYGILDKTGVMRNNISRKDIKAFTRYNTYRVEGLPYGPIGNPGKEALQAALSPDQSEYLYFVSRNNGTHVFTTNYKDHNKAVKKFQLDRKMRQGRSWRDRLKSK